MKLEELARPAVLTQPVYEPGRPIEDVARELGLDPKGIVKLASNENAFGPSPLAAGAAEKALRHAHLYPDGGTHALRGAIARARGVDPGQIVPGNGSNEIIELLGHVFLGPGDEAVMGTPAFIVYKLVTLLFGAKPVEVPLRNHRHDLGDMAAAVTDKTKLVFLPSPNNPTGTANDAGEITRFARDLPEHAVLVFDEAYAEYLDEPPDLRPLLEEGRPVVCLRTFSKIYGLAAFRLGYAWTTLEMAQLLNRVRQPFNVNAIGQAAAIAALEDREFLETCRAGNRAGLRQWEEGLKALELEWVPSEANFLLVRVGDGAEVFRRMQEAGVIVRPLAPYGLPEHVRVTIGRAGENQRALEALAAMLNKVLPS